MKPTLIGKTALMIGLAGVLALPFPALGEVSVEIDEATGEYITYHLMTNSSAKKSRIWDFNREGKKGIYPLNVEGDVLGDGLPVVEENVPGTGLPWAVWDRDGGSQRGLVWSTWNGSAWTPVVAVENRGGGDQGQPCIVFNDHGRPYLAFTQRAESGENVVRFTIFLRTVWAISIPVSGEGEEASSPSIEIVDDATVEITYDLPDGSSMVKTVTFQDPSTITDDVYPFLRDTASVTEGFLF
jgi:hypothetical protein